MHTKYNKLETRANNRRLLMQTQWYEAFTSTVAVRGP